jgi:hypothetical protein
MFEGILKGIQENPRDLEKIDVFLSLLSDADDTEAKADGLAELARIVKSTDILKALTIVQAAFRMSPQNKVVLEVLCETFQFTGNPVARNATQKYIENLSGKKPSSYENLNFDVMPHSESSVEDKTSTRRAEGLESESTVQHKTMIADPGVKIPAALEVSSPAEKPIPFSNFPFDDDATGQMDLNQSSLSFDRSNEVLDDKTAAYKQAPPAYKDFKVESSAPVDEDSSDDLFASPLPSPVAELPPEPQELQAFDGPSFGIVPAPEQGSVVVTEVAQEVEKEELPDLFSSEIVSLESIAVEVNFEHTQVDAQSIDPSHDPSHDPAPESVPLSVPLMESIPLADVPLLPPQIPVSLPSMPPLPPISDRQHEAMVTQVSRRALESIPAEVSFADPLENPSVPMVSFAIPPTAPPQKTQHEEHVTPPELTGITDTRSQPRSYKLIRNFIRETELDFRLLEYASEFADSWFGIIHFLSYLHRTGKIDPGVFARAAGVLERNVNEGDDVKAQVRFAEIIEPQLTATG